MVSLFLDISGGEILFVVLAALVIFGPKQAGAMARKAGKMLGELKKATSSIKDEIMNETEKVNETITQPLQNAANEIPAIDAAYEEAERKKRKLIEQDKKETEHATTI